MHIDGKAYLDKEPAALSMSRVVTLLLLCICLAGCSDSVGAAQDEVAEVAPIGSLPGVVVDIAIQPIAGATVVANPGGQTVTTDAVGAFRFDDLEPGTYALTASKAGFLNTTVVASVLADRPSPVAKMVLDHDPEAVAYVTALYYQGFVECAAFPFNWCGQANIASLILCEAYGACLGNITTDRSLAFHWLDRVPDFLQTEMVWEANNDLGENFLFVIGGMTREELAAGTGAALNTTRGPSPLMLQLDGPTLEEHSIGGERSLMTQLHPSPQEEIPGGCVVWNPCGPSFHAMQDYEYFTHAFYGYEPPEDWRFADAGSPLPP
jgi:hypothetical protein